MMQHHFSFVLYEIIQDFYHALQKVHRHSNNFVFYHFSMTKFGIAKIVKNVIIMKNIPLLNGACYARKIDNK